MTSELVRLEGLPEFEKTLKEFGKLYPEELRQSLNRAADRTATRVRRELSQSSGLPVREFKRRVQSYKTRRKGARTAAAVWVGMKSGIPLHKVQGASTTLSGILEAGKTRTQTFKATMPSGYTSSFVRKPGSSHKKGEKSKGKKLYGNDRTELGIEEPIARFSAIKTRAIIIKHSSEQLSDWLPDEVRRRVRVTNLRIARKSLRRTRQRLSRL